MMLVIAIGNSQRRDDGVAHAVLDCLISRGFACRTGRVEARPSGSALPLKRSSPRRSPLRPRPKPAKRAEVSLDPSRPKFNFGGGCFRQVAQLTPEIAADVAGHESVIFIDADASGSALRIEKVDPRFSPALTHVCSPGQIVALARSLFGFSGSAFLCRIPASDFSVGIGLSDRAEALAEEASAALSRMMEH